MDNQDEWRIARDFLDSFCRDSGKMPFVFQTVCNERLATLEAKDDGKPVGNGRQEKKVVALALASTCIDYADDARCMIEFLLSHLAKTYGFGSSAFETDGQTANDESRKKCGC